MDYRLNFITMYGYVDKGQLINFFEKWMLYDECVDGVVKSLMVEGFIDILINQQQFDGLYNAYVGVDNLSDTLRLLKCDVLSADNDSLIEALDDDDVVDMREVMAKTGGKTPLLYDVYFKATDDDKIKESLVNSFCMLFGWSDIIRSISIMINNAFGFWVRMSADAVDSWLLISRKCSSVDFAKCVDSCPIMIYNDYGCFDLSEEKLLFNNNIPDKIK